MSIYDDARAAVNAVGNANVISIAAQAALTTAQAALADAQAAFDSASLSATGATAGLTTAETALSTLVAGHADLTGVTALEPNVTTMLAFVNAAELAAAPMPLVVGLSAEGMNTNPPSVVNGICNVYARDLQKTAGGPIVHPNAIDKAIATGKPFDVRLFFGMYSPQYMFDLTGGGAQVHDSNDNVTASVVHWWDPRVQAAQTDLVTKLAADYDGEISAIFIATMMTIYAEPCRRDTSSAITRASLKATGYTSALDKASFQIGFNMFKAFKRTRPAFSFNPWEYMNADGTYGVDVTFTNALIDAFRATWPDGRAIIQNNSVRYPELGGAYTTMYAYMSGKKPLRFQTATAPRVGSYAKTLDSLVAMGAHAVELSPGYADPTQPTFLTAAQLAHYDAALRANAA